MAVSGAKLRELNYFMHGEEQHPHIRDEREKRGILEFLPVIGGVVESIFNFGTAFIKNKNDADIFDQRFMSVTQSVSDNSKDLVSFKHKQYSFNMLIEKKNHKIESMLNKTEARVQALEDAADLHYALQEIVFQSNNLKNTIDEILNGAISAAKSLPARPFLEPQIVSHVMKQYEEEERYEKAFFSKRNVSSIYQMIESKLVIRGSRMAVVSTIQIPTQSSVGRLYAVVPYPIYDENNANFVTLEDPNREKYIAINRENEYLQMSISELNACKNHHDITICNTQEKIWVNSETPSCLSSIYFEKKEDAGRMCNFQVEVAKDEIIKPVHLHGGHFHFALQATVALYIQCHDNDEIKIEWLTGNGVLAIGADCKATLGKHLITNMGIERKKHIVTTTSQIKYNFSSIALQKFGDTRARKQLTADDVNSQLNQDDLDEFYITKTLMHEIDEAKQEKEKEIQQLRRENESALREAWIYRSIIFGGLGVLIVAIIIVACHSKRQFEIIKKGSSQRDKKDKDEGSSPA